MPPRRKSEPQEEPIRRRRATTPEARENQLVAFATDLAEVQLREGTASAQVISHYLKLGSSREKLEQERLALENQFLDAKREALQSQARVEQLMTDALNAFRSYSGQDPQELPSDEDYYDD